MTSVRVIAHNVLTAHGTGHLRVYDLTSHSITAVVAAHAVRATTPRTAHAAALALASASSPFLRDVTYPMEPIQLT